MRIKNLDFLRAIAIIGVLFQHSSWVNRFTQVGWTGVDLFFVLSGFLVSSLLFNEIKKSDSVNPKLFLIRRGFKIYPAFYFFLFSTLVYKYLFNQEKYDIWHMLSEIFFLQSYLPSIWLHSWSLAIEEHFYFFIALLIWLMTITGFIFKKRQVFYFLFFLWLIMTSMRFTYCILHKTEEPIRFFASHLRGDGLFFGCILAYCFTFIEKIKNIFNQFRLPLFIMGFALITPLFFWKTGSFYMDSLGITSLQFGFAIFIGLSALNRPLSISKRLIPVYNIFCFIGLHSYSIYLWHAFVMEECDRHITNILYHTLIYIPSSILIGILFSKIIEWPALRMRERFFPQKLSET